MGNVAATAAEEEGANATTSPTRRNVPPVEGLATSSSNRPDDRTPRPTPGQSMMGSSRAAGDERNTDDSGLTESTTSSSSTTSPDGHPYANACLQFPREYYDYERFRIDWASPDPYLLSRKIGRGKYSEVFTATNRVLDLPCVVKMLKPVKEKRLAREVLILQNLCGVPNVISLYDMVMDEETGTPALVFEAVNNTDHKELYPTFTDMDVRYYMYEILKTLDLAHSVGIMHRDLKPQNMCMDHAARKLRLIDWGLADFYFPDRKYGVRVGSKHYKGPELWVGNGYYDYAVDIWAAGCVFAAMVLKVATLFRVCGRGEMIERIIQLCGTASVMDYVVSLGIDPTKVFTPSMLRAKPVPKADLRRVVAGESAGLELATDDAMDLLDKMFVVDHRQRITAGQAMQHRYFDPVRPRPQQHS